MLARSLFAGKFRWELEQAEYANGGRAHLTRAQFDEMVSASRSGRLVGGAILEFSGSRANNIKSGRG